MFEKKYVLNFSSQARTLSPEKILGDKFNVLECNSNYSSPEFLVIHENGWTISGTVSEDYYVWINEFHASHPIFGSVGGDFEDFIYASSEEAFENFLEHYPYDEWDYYDI